MALAPLVPLAPLKPAVPVPVSTCAPIAPGAAGSVFGDMLGQLLGTANGQQVQADRSVLDLATGRTDNIHDVTLAVAKADLMFRLVLTIRNRLTEAYQEVARMPV